MLKKSFARLAFLPTISYQMMMRVVAGRRWMDRVDEHVIIGALPLSHNVETLYAEGVRGVINLCEEYLGPLKRYARKDIVQLHLPTLDYCPPTLQDIQSALTFIQEQKSRGHSTYIHCKAGRGRSATIVLCYLLATTELGPLEAQRALQKIRPRVIQNLWKREIVQEFVKFPPVTDPPGEGPAGPTI